MKVFTNSYLVDKRIFSKKILLPGKSVRSVSNSGASTLFQKLFCASFLASYPIT